jgi:predicted RNA-binding protein YlxR (DUF448 family)
MLNKRLSPGIWVCPSLPFYGADCKQKRAARAEKAARAAEELYDELFIFSPCG